MRYLIWDSIVVIVLINNIENPSLIGPLNQAPQADEEKWSVYFIESIFLKVIMILINEKMETIMSVRRARVQTLEPSRQPK